MKKATFLTGLCAATALAGFSSGAFAQTEILVPTDHTTIAAAIAAASDDDTIIIEDSATYAENLTVDKTVTIVAEAGETPVIQVAADYVFDFTGTDKTLTIGSSDGGRITLESGAHGVRAAAGSSGTVNLNNLTINATSTYNGFESRTANVSLYMDDVLVDGQGSGIYGIFISFVAVPTTPPTYSVKNSTFTNLLGTSNAILIRNFNGEGNLVVESSVINGGAFAITTDLRASDASGPFTVNVDLVDSVFTSNRPATVSHPIRFRAGRYHLTAERSVFWNRDLGPAFEIFNDANVLSNSTYAFNHCDFVAAGEQLATRFLGPDSDVTIENSIIVAGAGQTGIVGNATSDLTSRHNAISADTLYADWNSETIVSDLDFTPGAPAYLDPAAYDFRYLEPEALLTASETGGLVGSNYDFVNRAGGSPLVLVPNDEDSITSGLLMVTPGGTVRIMDSAVYEETLALNKAGVTLEAAVGAEPTVLNPGGQSFLISASQPVQIGTNAGGRITFDANGGSGLTHLLNNSNAAGTTVTLENTVMQGMGSGGSIIYPGTSGGDLLVRDSHIDGTGNTYPVRIDFVNPGETLRFENSIIEASGVAIHTNTTGGGTLDLVNTYVKGGGRTLNMSNTAGDYFINIIDSYIVSDGGPDAVYIRATPTVYAENSVFHLVSGTGNAFYAFPNGAATTDMSLTFINCDFVAETGFAAFRTSQTPDTVDSVDVYTFINSNLIHYSDNRSFNGAPRAVDVVTLNYNSVPGARGGFPATEDVEYDIVPDYANIDNGDFSYTDSTLITGDSTGGPVGSFRDFGPLMGIVTSVMDWQLLH